MDLQIEGRGGVTVIRPAEARLDALGAVAFKDRMKAAVEGAPGRVVLDLSGVGFIDSSGLGAVVAVRRFLRAGQALDLAGLTAPVARVFRLTRMDMLFAIHPEVADALRETA